MNAVDTITTSAAAQTVDRRPRRPSVRVPVLLRRVACRPLPTMAPESAATAEVPLRKAPADVRGFDDHPRHAHSVDLQAPGCTVKDRTRQMLVPRKKVFIGVFRMIHDP